MVDIIYYAYERTKLLKLAFLVRVEQFLEQPTFLSSQDQNSVSEGQSISTAFMINLKREVSSTNDLHIDVILSGRSLTQVTNKRDSDTEPLG